jgi:hypothetical protein
MDMTTEHEALRPVTILEVTEQRPVTDVVSHPCPVAAPVGWSMAEIDEGFRCEAELVLKILGQFVFG